MNAQPKHRRWHQRFRHSLKWRLVALFLLLALGMSLAFIFGTQRALSLGWRDAVKPLLSDYVDRLTLEIGSPPDAARALALTARLPISVRIQGPTVTLDTHPREHLEQWHRGQKQAEAAGHFADTDADTHRDNPGLLQRQTKDGHTITFGLGDLNWRRGPGPVGWYTLATLLALTAIAYLAVRRMLKPLDDIGAGAQRFGVGDFSTPIRQRRRDELGDLAGQINTMGRDIHSMLEAKRGLLLSISHELRSPLTRARLNTELLPESADTQEQRAALLRDLAEMARLITDLLESERLATRHAALNLEPTDLAQLAREVVAGCAGGHPVQLDVQPALPLFALDPVRLRLLLRNLIDNALRFNPASGPPCEVQIRWQMGQVEIAVRDFGSGVDASQLQHLAEPFFRPDASRQRSTGGVGLGLYLCKLVAQAHRGSLSIRNASPGLEVCVTLPLDHNSV